MNKWMKSVLALAAAAGAVGASALYVNKVEHQSLRSKLFAGLIGISGTKKRFFSEQLMQASIQEVEDSKDYVLPDKAYKSAVGREEVQGYPVYTFNDKQDREQKVVLYIHGGAWVYQPTGFHWAFIDKLAQATGAKVVAPIYPKAPKHTFEATFALLRDLYSSAVNAVDDASQLTIMGDSAGGNISLLLGQRLEEWGLPQPGNMIAFSPSLDLSFDNPAIQEYMTNDPMLAVPGARYAASRWAGSEDVRSPLLSPLHGDFSKVAKVTMFYGTYEGGYPDGERWDEQLTAAGIPHNFYVYPKMIHVFPLYPIPEADRAFEQIVAAMEETA
ncbi:alpha/beta hydrolase [Saccharibacillus sp. CPCC 101409]|uniref:alpha/beta hydrolase n=1 Tax=Saccharibacillus sp. CPCC 101409 TaxID=3058041 RepID=UPI002671F0B4|nr:alpha/beta hydrolase [Saccharibacillus sp. CPCC 101409]MDO3412452.1 alpha/beta hydrolase [Saccharibacillus sp. CPCC 101409]